MDFLLSPICGTRLTISRRRPAWVEPHTRHREPWRRSIHGSGCRLPGAWGPWMAPAAEGLADLLAHAAPRKVLDVSASHGMWGIALARRHPEAELVALDWAPVLEVTRENAAASRGIGAAPAPAARGRLKSILARGYDVIRPRTSSIISRWDCVRSSEGPRRPATGRIRGHRGVRAEP